MPDATLLEVLETAAGGDEEVLVRLVQEELQMSEGSARAYIAQARGAGRDNVRE